MKAIITEHDVEQGTDRWLAIRADRYTGTDADKLLRFGRIPYILISKGANAFGGNYWTKRGHLLEEKAISLYERIKGVVVRRPGFITNSLYEMAGYSPDGLTDLILIEVKCFDKKKHLKMWHGDVPFKVLAQIHFGLFITGRKVAHLLIYNPEFAKKDDPDYDPKLAFKIIVIKHSPAIAANFKRILTEENNYATHPQAA